MKLVMSQSAVDIWRVGAEGTVDMRMSRSIAAVVLHYIPECYLLIDNVEAHVQGAEQQLVTSQAVLGPGRTRNMFKKYVSKQLCRRSNHRPLHSLLFVSLSFSTSMRLFLNGMLT